MLVRPSRSPSLATSIGGLLAAAALAGGCGPGAAAEAIRPSDPTAAGTLGEGPKGECHEVESSAEPLVVDWKIEQRSDLEEAMHDGVAVVAYSCEGIKLLKDCHIDGKYGFLGMTKREQVVKLNNSDELKANLPLSGASMAAKLSGELARGATIDIAMVMVGKKRTTWTEPSRDDLKGKCDGATHFIRGAIVGAFTLQTGTKAQVKAAVEMFHASVDAASSSEKNVRNQDGDPGDCAKSSPDAEKAPAQCGAVVRLALGPLLPAKAAGAADPPKPPEKPAGGGEPDGACPKGLVFTAGKCAAPDTTVAFQCHTDNAPECTTQCDKGHTGSCGTLGRMYMVGHPVGRDPGRATALLKKACDGGEARSCSDLGVILAEGWVGPKDEAEGAKLYEKGCSNGNAGGCTRLGRAYLSGKGVTADPAKAASLLKQACEGGDEGGCAGAATLYAEGKGVPADIARAADYYKRACDGGDAPSCSALGEMYETGRAGRTDPIYAKMLYQRGCFRAHGPSCTNLGLAELAGFGADPSSAKRHLEQGCMWRDALGCAAMKVAYGDTKPVFPDVARQQALLQSCHGGSARACIASGLLEVASGNKVQGVMSLDHACTAGSQVGCELAKKAK